MSTMDTKIIIAGGSGFLGVSLAHHLAGMGHRVVILSRSKPKIAGPWSHISWDARTLGPWTSELNGAIGLVNLAGRSVDCVKTPDHQDEILRSRVESTRILGDAIRAIDHPPPVWVQMSTAHIYGDPPDVICDEDSPTGCGLAPFVGRAWEEAYAASVLPTQRKVILRTSFVIGRDRGAGGGALSRLKTLVRLGLGGTVGSGRQGMSWIHEDDMNRLFERALFEETMRDLCRIISTPGLPARLHALAAPLDEVSNRPASLQMDGPPWRPTGDEDRPRARPLRPVRPPKAPG